MKLIIMIYLLFLLTACNENPDKPEIMKMMAPPPAEQMSKEKMLNFGDGESESSTILQGAALQTSDSLKAVSKKMLIKNGRIEIEVRDII